MSLPISFSMFFLSFTPLWISILFIDIKSLIENEEYLYTEIISISTIVIVSIISIIVLLANIKSRNTNGAETFSIVKASEEKTITAEFFLSYILPLFAFEFTEWDGVVLFLIFFGVLAYLSIKHNHFSVNIMLELLHYKFYLCELSNSDNTIITKTIITKEILSSQINSDIHIRSINNEYSIQINI